MPRPISLVVPWLFSCMLGACAPEEPASPGEVILSEIDTLISTRSGILAQPVAMAVDREGTLLVLDGQMGQIHRVATDGTVLSSIGQQGSGPGEFRRPTALRVNGDTIWVIDSGNGRLQVLDVDGSSIETFPLPPRVGYFIARLTSDGRILGSTLGQDSCLAIAYDKTAQELARVGVPPFEPPSLIDMGKLKEEIRAGNIPAFLRSSVVPSEAPGDQIWLAMLADGELARFDRDGDPLGVVSLQEPEMPRILSDFFARNQEETERPSLYPLMYATDLQPVGSEVWVLLNSGDEEPAVLVAFSPEGEKLRRILIPDVLGAQSFVADPSRRRLFLAIPSSAQIVVATIDFMEAGRHRSG